MLCFWEHGFDKTSIGDLENCTGLKRTSLYNSFGNKDDLFKAVIDYFIKTQCAYWVDIMHSEDRFIDGVDKLMGTMISENFDTRHPTGCLITYSAAGIDHHCDDIKKAIRHGHEMTISGIKQALEKGIRNGELEPATDRDALALFILNSFQGIMVLSKTVGSRSSLKKVKDLALAVLSQHTVPHS
jgi:TetR/AcrR family transcriptional repressor of nem operon